MHRFFVIVTILTTAIIVAAPEATARDTKAYRNFSRAKLINICARACGPHGSARWCCICNDGYWTGNRCA